MESADGILKQIPLHKCIRSSLLCLLMSVGRCDTLSLPLSNRPARTAFLATQRLRHAFPYPGPRPTTVASQPDFCFARAPQVPTTCVASTLFIRVCERMAIVMRVWCEARLYRGLVSNDGQVGLICPKGRQEGGQKGTQKGTQKGARKDRQKAPKMAPKRTPAEKGA